jgi:mannitol-specific phosphotransferase system IIBC component
MESNVGTGAGTVGGTLVTIVANINREGILKTAALAGIGAVVSFCVSHLLKRFLLFLNRFF